MPQIRDLTGKKFGRLTAVERIDRIENRYCVWRCKCECGGEAYVNTKRLLRGTVTNCGCIPKTNARRGQIAEDLTGRHFGEWKVLRRDENRNGKTMWLCRCSCGTVRAIASKALKAGRTHSCRNPIHNNPLTRRDLTGQTLGGLQVLYPTEKRDYKGSVMWHCRCLKCGREKNFSEDNLVHQNYKSCGCGQYIFGKELPKLHHYYNGTSLESITLNRKVRSDSKTGVMGVHQKKNGTYRATIAFQGKHYHLGVYPTLSEASDAYIDAKKTLHGSFINAYTAWKESKEDNELIFNVNYVNGEFLIQSNYLPKAEDTTPESEKEQIKQKIKYIIKNQTSAICN